MSTYYVIGAGGSDSNGGTNDTTDGWATIDKAMNTVAAGDTVYVKATGTYSETPNIDTAGTLTLPITFEGYGTTTGDNNKVTVTGTTNCLTSSITGATYYFFKNFIFTGGSSSAVSMPNSDNICWFNCEFNNSGSMGASVDDAHIFIKCVSYGNTLRNFDPDLSPVFLGCISYNCGTNYYNFYSEGTAIMYKCVAYGRSGSSGGNAYLKTAYICAGCTFDGDGSTTGDGNLSVTFDVDSVILDNILYDDRYGVNGGSGWNAVNGFVGYNLLNSNSTSDYNNVSGGLTGFGDVTSAPAFIDEAGDNYAVANTSPAVGAGLVPGGIT